MRSKIRESQAFDLVQEICQASMVRPITHQLPLPMFLSPIASTPTDNKLEHHVILTRNSHDNFEYRFSIFVHLTFTFRVEGTRLGEGFRSVLEEKNYVKTYKAYFER